MNFGLTKRTEIRIPTFRGLAVVTLIAILLLMALFCNIHSFLAINDPLPADLLVVEGWLPDYAILAAFNEFENNDYNMLITTGEPVLYGHYLAAYRNHAEIAAATLRRMGVDSSKLVVIPGEGVQKDRTYACARSVKLWLDKKRPAVHAINLVTLGPHARRSRLLFQKAMGNDIKVGIIAAENLSYNEENWWQGSNGVRTILSELIGYVYAKLYFFPDK